MNYVGGFGRFVTPATLYRHWLRPRKAKNLQLEGLKVLITGGNKGIGLETVRFLSRYGRGRVTVCARSVKDFHDISVALSNPFCKVDYVKLDLGDLSSISNSVAECLKLHNQGFYTENGEEVRVGFFCQKIRCPPP